MFVGVLNWLSIEYEKVTRWKYVLRFLLHLRPLSSSAVINEYSDRTMLVKRWDRKDCQPTLICRGWERL